MTLLTHVPHQDLSGHVFDTVSDSELQRRWSAVAAAMEVADIDVLVMQNVSDGNGGYTRYFCDIQATIGYPVSVLFERDGTLTVHHHGEQGGGRPLGRPGLATARSAPQVLTSWTFTSAHFCESYEPDTLLKVLQRHARGTIGLVGRMQMTASFSDGIRAGLPHATFVDASDLVDRVKVVKSEEELVLIRLAAAVQVHVLEAVFAAAVPGATEYECVIAGVNRSREMGSEGGVIAVNSAPKGTPAVLNPMQKGPRVLQAGDSLTFLFENNGPGGWYTEIGRTAVLGPVDAQHREEGELAAELQQFALGLLQPGRPASEAFRLYSERLRAEGLPAETRLFCHGQGVDIVERPLIRTDEQLTIAGPLNMACHPAWTRNGLYTWMCDNFIVGVDGVVETLTTVPHVVFELG